MNNKWLKVSLVAVVGVIAVVMASPKMDAQSPPAATRTICHRGQTLSVAEAVVAAHLSHGDTVGACVVTPVNGQ